MTARGPILRRLEQVENVTCALVEGSLGVAVSPVESARPSTVLLSHHLVWNTQSLLRLPRQFYFLLFAFYFLEHFYLGPHHCPSLMFSLKHG